MPAVSLWKGVIMEFFSPGRTEIIGNHTDHQLGRVIASSVRPGIHASAVPACGSEIVINSDGFSQIHISLSDLSPREAERGTAAALCRGMASSMRRCGFELGAFTADVHSELRPGGGLSSSAAFTLLIGRIISGLFNGGSAEGVTLARCAQQAENEYFGKPCGLMDQLACAAGGGVYIDFFNGDIVPLNIDFRSMGLILCLTDTGGSHDALTDSYAAIPADMHAVAASLGVNYLGEADPRAFFSMPKRGDIQYTRALHFFEENERVSLMKKAIESSDRDSCIRLINESGRSSEENLKNIVTSKGGSALERGLLLSRRLLEGTGAWRVHGGGFAGCVQALLPEEAFPSYKSEMEKEFGVGSCFDIM